MTKLPWCAFKGVEKPLFRKEMQRKQEGPAVGSQRARLMGVNRVQRPAKEVA
jgi:hypothetical protein